jgi:cystathionine beta-lyase
MYDFDKVSDALKDRTKWQEVKWTACKNGEVPMFVADMDFQTPQPIIDALKERMEHPFFGYNSMPANAIPAIAQHYRDKYHCQCEEEWIVFVPSVMPGVNVACMAAGGSIMYCDPMYMHIRAVAKEIGVPEVSVPLKIEDGKYTFDFEAMEAAYTPDIKSFILCSPHNPVGRVWTKEELQGVYNFCRKHDILLVADEIHCEIILEGQHTPCFTIAEDAPEHTVTVSSAGKICNIPGLPIGFAIIPNKELREKFEKEVRGLFSTRGTTLYGIAIKKAYDGSCEQWKEELRDYLRSNRDYLEERIAKMPYISVNHNEATYLAWIDCTALPYEDPADFFKTEAKVIMNPGSGFGAGKFCRLNFACPRSQLKEALDRIENTLNSLKLD